VGTQGHPVGLCGTKLDYLPRHLGALPSRPRFGAADRECPLCHAFVAGGTSLRVLAQHFQVCPVLDSSA
jgi:hypothetical protein